MANGQNIRKKADFIAKIMVINFTQCKNKKAC